MMHGPKNIKSFNDVSEYRKRELLISQEIYREAYGIWICSMNQPH